MSVRRLCALDHIGRRVAGNNFGVKIDATCLGDPARTFEYVVIFVVFSLFDLDDLIDRRRKVGRFLH